MTVTITSDVAGRGHGDCGAIRVVPQTVAVYASVHGHAQAVVVAPGLGHPSLQRPLRHQHQHGK